MFTITLIDSSGNETVKTCDGTSQSRDTDGNLVDLTLTWDDPAIPDEDITVSAWAIIDITPPS